MHPSNNSSQPKQYHPISHIDPRLQVAYTVGWDKKMAMMTPYYEPLPTMYLPDTFEGPHQSHHHPLFMWRHKAGRFLHNPDLETHIPNTDARETHEAYYLDIELPGVDKKSIISIKWVSTRTVLVQARTDRPCLPTCPVSTDKGTKFEGDENGRCASCNPLHNQTGEVQQPSTSGPEHGISEENSLKKETTGIGATEPPKAASIPSTGDNKQSHGKKNAPHLVVSERAIGYFARNFNFPVQVDYQKMKATLNAGLLRLEVPKKLADEPVSHEVKVE